MDISNMELGNLLFGNSRGEYAIPRGFTEGTWEWDDRFAKFFTTYGLDYHGFASSGYKVPANNRGGITTKLFEVNPYYWGDDDKEAIKPNFFYYPTGFSLKWYKYPLRDAYANQPITYEEFDGMLTNCERMVE